jgi:hypothetical protein
MRRRELIGLIAAILAAAALPCDLENLKTHAMCEADHLQTSLHLMEFW